MAYGHGHCIREDETATAQARASGVRQASALQAAALTHMTPRGQKGRDREPPAHATRTLITSSLSSATVDVGMCTVGLGLGAMAAARDAVRSLPAAALSTWAGARPIFMVEESLPELDQTVNLTV